MPRGIHTMLAMTAGALEGSRLTYLSRIAELKSKLQSAGIFYNENAYPYFFRSTTYTSANQFKTWATKAASLGISTEDLVGIAYNLNYFVHEPGAYAHNSIYTNRVLYDSIDTLPGLPAPSFGRP